MWRRVRINDFMYNYHRLRRAQGLGHCVVQIDRADGFATIVTVWSRDGINLLRRDSFWALAGGRWVLQTSVYLMNDEPMYFRTRGVRMPVCRTCDARCCKDQLTTVVLTHDEIRDVERGTLDWPIEYDCCGATLTTRDDGSCVFLTDSNRCGIYKKRRPVGCRVWFCGRGTDKDKEWRKISVNMKLPAAA